ncbi:MAG TPA: PD-(D/E)XK nuclease family protein [Bacillota bacterium]|nr:PD-(D/E)XK nuclease family protein [Bacillota bacterium]HPT87241.1 PD-(D/E)XK nuclease family protein [Bacillota bacterium]
MKVTAVIGELKNHRELLTLLRQAAEKHEFSLTVIFPTISLLRQVQEELLSQPDIGGIGGFRLLLFEGFIGELREQFGLNRRTPSSLERDLLIEYVIDQLESEGRFHYLNRIPFNWNYRRAILDGISEWKRSGLRVELFTEWASDRGRKEAELALIYAGYQEMLRSCGFAEDDLTLEELEELRMSGMAAAVPGRVVLYGFNDLTPFQIDLIATLALWYEFEAIIDPTAVPEFQEFTRNYFSFGSRLLSAESVDSDRVLSRLQQVFWTGDPEPITMSSEDCSVQLIQAAGPRAFSGIAREIVRLRQRESEWSDADVLILAPRPQQFITEATPIFQEYGIRLSGAEVPLKETIPVWQFQQLLRVVAEDWKWPEMQEYLRQLYSGNRVRQGDRLIQLIIRQIGALSGRERWLHLMDDPAFRELLEAEQIDPEPLRVGLRRLEPFIGEATLGEYVRLTLEWFRAYERSVWMEGIGKSLAPADIFRQRVARQMADSLTGFLETDPRLARTERVISFEDYARFFDAYFINSEIKAASAGEEGIRVISPREVRGLAGRFVFITGLEQGNFPRHYINDWKLDPNDRFDLQTLGVMLENGENYQLQEKLSFYWGLQAAREQLFLIYQEQEADGQLANRSPFLDEVLQWVPELSERLIYYPLEPKVCDGFDDCRSELEVRQVWLKYSLQEEHALPAGDVGQYQALFQLAPFRRLASGALHWMAYRRSAGEGMLVMDDYIRMLLDRLFGDTAVIGITAIEDYLVCPYRFFLKHFLKIRPLPEASLLPEALDLGNFYHQVLSEFCNRFRGQAFRRERMNEYRECLDQLASATLASWKNEAANDLVRVMLVAQESEIRRTLERWLVAELDWSELTLGRFVPYRTELAFGQPYSSGEKAELPPLILQDGEISARFSGRVDRVDTDGQNRFIIYDYKLGRGPSTADVLELQRVQLAAYVLAMEQLMFGEGQAVGGAYLGLRDPSRSTGGVWQQERLNVDWRSKSSLSPEEWQQWLEQVRMRIVNAVRQIREGRFGLTTEECPDYCEYQSCCRRKEREVEAVGACSE